MLHVCELTIMSWRLGSNIVLVYWVLTNWHSSRKQKRESSSKLNFHIVIHRFFLLTLAKVSVKCFNILFAFRELSIPRAILTEWLLMLMYSVYMLKIACVLHIRTLHVRICDRECKRLHYSCFDCMLNNVWTFSWYLW